MNKENILITFDAFPPIVFRMSKIEAQIMALTALSIIEKTESNKKKIDQWRIVFEAVLSGKTYKEAAELINVSKSRATQIFNKTLMKVMRLDKANDPNKAGYHMRTSRKDLCAIKNRLMNVFDTLLAVSPLRLDE